MYQAQRIAALVRDVPDFPRPGVLFKDLTPLLADGPAFAAVVDRLSTLALDADVVVGVEARGFLLGAAVAHALGVGIVPIRKAGKLPAVAASRSYALEYGVATLEIPANVLPAGSRVLVVDDVLATGGTVEASCELLEQVGVRVSGIAVVLELTALGGRARLAGRPLHALLTA